MYKLLSIGSFICFLLATITGCSQAQKPSEAKSAKDPAYVHEVLELDTYLAQLKAETGPYHFVDVRTPEEVAEGTIGDAVNIDYKSDDFKAKIKALDSSQPIYLFCRSGNRSGKAAKILIESGYKEVYDLKGGYVEYVNKK